MSKPRLLMVTRNFPPLWGGMERLNWHMAQELGKQFEVRVVGPQGAAAHAPSGVGVLEAPLQPLPTFLLAAARLARRAARAWQPHVVLAGSGLAAPIALWAARACGAQAVVYVHGLDLTVPHRVYRALWLPALRRMDRVIANSHATAQLAEQAGIRKARIAVLHPGVELQSPDSVARASFRAKFDLGDRHLLLSVGRLTSRKGLHEFVVDVLPLIITERQDVVLLVVGDSPKQALFHEGVSPQSILDAADAAKLSGHVRFLGKLPEADLQAAYQAADVHVFPVRHVPHDPEGFGMVAVEAAAQGLTTVAYATGGVVDAVGDGVSGYLIQPEDSTGFAGAVLSLLARPLPKDDVRAFAARFAWPKFGSALCQLMATTQC